MPLEIRGAHFFNSECTISAKTRLEQALATNTGVGVGVEFNAPLDTV